jgi:magnesium protoporphyrin O-methyltransferase
VSGFSEEYWEGVAEEFDTFYRKEKDALRKLIDKVFRKNMTERLTHTLQECKSVSGKRILDIGCGSGRLTIELAKRGAQVVGIDFSSSMLDLADSLAKRHEVADNCRFIHENFLNYKFRDNFDVAIALGFFDYTEDPTPYLQKMSALTEEKCIMSFPSKFAFQVPLRMIWLKSRKLPVYFYTKRQIKHLLALHFPRVKIKKISAGFFSVAFAEDPKLKMSLA